MAPTLIMVLRSVCTTAFCLTIILSTLMSNHREHRVTSSRLGRPFLASLSVADYEPQQVHLSWTGQTGEDGQMTVTWSTMKLPAATSNLQRQSNHKEFFVRFGQTSNIEQSATAIVNKFIDGGLTKRAQYIYRATMSGMLPNCTYFYTVGSTRFRTRLLRFRTMQRKADYQSPRLLLLGDLGTTNGERSLQEMQREVDAGWHDLAVHNGDFAYDMNSDEGKRGDLFMRQIEPIASKIPYMVTAGNHEQAYNFSHYIQRFSMPGDSESLYYSLDMGALHMVFISTEFWYYPQYDNGEARTLLNRQYRWIEQDLRRARQRNAQWLVVAGHHPMYCSTPDLNVCNPLGSLLVDGIAQLNIPGLEELFQRYGVDVFLAAHVHSYERLWPIYKCQVRNGTVHPYHDARATIYIVNGAAGNDENQTPFLRHPYKWSAFHSTAYGFMRMRVHNDTCLFVEQIGIDRRNGTRVVDRARISKSEPKPAWLRQNLVV